MHRIYYALITAIIAAYGEAEVSTLTVTYYMSTLAREQLDVFQGPFGSKYKSQNLNLSRVTKELFLTNFADARSKIKSNDRNNCTTITISFSNLEYANAFENWYNMVGACSLIIALDEETCKYLKSHYLRRHLCMFVPSSVKLVFSSDTVLYDKEFKGNFLISMAKFMYPGILVFCDKSVIVTEMDVFWHNTVNVMSDLFHANHSDFDAQVSSHILYSSTPQQKFSLAKGEINIGFFFIRTNFRSKLMYMEMINYAVHHTVEMGSYRTWDQKLYDRFIRFKGRLPIGDEASQWDHHFKDFDHFVKVSHWHRCQKNNETKTKIENNKCGIRWRRLPSTYTTNIGRRGSKLQFHAKTATVHISFGIKEPMMRIYCGYKLGLINKTFIHLLERQGKSGFCFEVFDANNTFIKKI